MLNDLLFVAGVNYYDLLCIGNGNVTAQKYKIKNEIKNLTEKIMTIEEYSALMGYGEICEWTEYVTADTLYMALEDMDKQTFCREYKKIAGSPLVQLISSAVRKSGKVSEDASAQNRHTAFSLLRQAARLRRGIVSKEDMAECLDGMAMRLIDRKSVIRHKIANNFQLTEDDLKYITDNLE